MDHIMNHEMFKPIVEIICIDRLGREVRVKCNTFVTTIGNIHYNSYIKVFIPIELSLSRWLEKVDFCTNWNSLAANCSQEAFHYFWGWRRCVRL